MLKEIDQTKNGMSTSQMTQKNKSKRKKRKKKQKKPKKWNFENRIKKVTDDEKIHLDWDAPILDSPDRRTRQSWTIYNDPDDTPARYPQNQGKPGTVSNPSQFNRNGATQPVIGQKKEVLMKGNGVSKGGNKGNGGNGANEGKDMNSCKFVNSNLEIVVYNENESDLKGKQSYGNSEIKESKNTSSVKFKNAPEPTFWGREQTSPETQNFVQMVEKEAKLSSGNQQKSQRTYKLSKNTKTSQTQKNQSTKIFPNQNKPSKTQPTKEKYEVPVKNLTVLVSNSSQKFQGKTNKFVNFSERNKIASNFQKKQQLRFSFSADNPEISKPFTILF